MNDSGAALHGLRAATPDDTLADLLVLVDDFALETGSFRLRGSGSAGGHNGLTSIEAEVGTRHYARLRIGIGPRPEGLDQAEFVLGVMPPDERRLVEEQFPLMGEAVECWAADGIERAMARYNRRRKPPEP